MEANDLLLGDGRVGYLEHSEWKKARWAYDYADKFLPWLDSAGYVNFTGGGERVDSSSSNPVGVPATAVAADTIRRLITEIDRWPYMETAAKDKIGASRMIDLGREMASAVHRWPMEEKPRKITVMTCGGCDKLTLASKPPRFPGDKIIISCYCGYELSPAEYALAMHIILKDIEEGAYAITSTESTPSNQP